MLPSKTSLQGEMRRVALHHIDYGARRKHAEAFQGSLVRSLRRLIVREGGSWSPAVERGWQWVIGESQALLFSLLEELGPNVQAVRNTWQHLIQARSMGAGHITGSTKSSAPQGSKSGSGSGSRAGSQAGSGSTRSSLLSRGQKSPSGNGRHKLASVIKVELDDDRATTDAHLMAVIKLGNELSTIFRDALPDKGRGFEWGPNYGRGLGQAVDLIVETATQPEGLERELWSLAQLHLELGIDAAQLNVFGNALLQLLRSNLSDEVWASAEAGWGWIWATVRKIFLDVLLKWQAMEESLAVSWEILLKRGGGSVGVGEKFYGLFFERAPVLQEMFQKRNETMIDSFAKALDLVVRCSRDRRLFDNELQDLAVSHCKFDMQSWHFDVFGDVLMEVLSTVAGEEWSDQFQEAWLLLYSSIRKVFLQVLDSARSSMCSALVRSSVDGVAAALKDIQRGERASQVVVLGAGKRQMSPILWALRDGLHDIVELLLDDVFAIRCDRANCYYGMETMWQRCPMILAVLVEVAPQYLENFLDGHMWVSPAAEGGLRRVNFWVRHLYGEPDLVPNVFEGPLGILAECLPEAHFDVFSHPAVRATIDLKWRRFGIRRVLEVCISHFLCLVAYIFVGYTDGTRTASKFIACLAWLLMCIFLLVRFLRTAFRQWRTGRVQIIAEACGCAVKAPRCFHSFYSRLRLLCCVLSLVLIVIMLAPCRRKGADIGSCVVESKDLPRSLSAAVAFLQWILVTEFFKLNEKLSAIFYLGRAMLSDAFRFMMAMIVWLLAVGAAISRLIGTAKYDSDFASAYSLFALMLGVGDDGDLTFYDGGSAAIVRTIFLVSLWVSIIPILNLMIAAMVSTYSRAEQNTHSLSQRARASAVLEAEESMSYLQRMRHFTAIGFDDPLPFAALDKGPPGGVSILCTSKHLQHHDSYRRRTDTVRFFSGDVGPEHPWPPHRPPPLGRSRTTHDGQGPPAAASEAGQVGALRTELAELKGLLRGSGFGGVAPTSSAKVSAPTRPAFKLHCSELAAVSKAMGPEHCLVAVEGLLYDAGPLLGKHPGGKAVLLAAGGTDATADFVQVHRRLDAARSALAVLPVVGVLVLDDAKTEVLNASDYLRRTL
mmetsp:Transcript_34854/g.92673  ORF Transcript_34854/g.92673 Transcript_34854/m.92673 type:complete len:1113 (-) Transcript_34854:36-3374(-)